MNRELQVWFVGRDLQVKVHLQLALERYPGAYEVARLAAFTQWDELRGALARPTLARTLLVLDTHSIDTPAEAHLHALAAWRAQHPLGRVVALRGTGQAWPAWVATLRPDFTLPRDLSVGRWQLALDRLLRPELEVLLAAPVDPALPPHPDWLVKRAAEVQLREALAEVRAKAMLLWSVDNRPWARAGELPATLWGYILRRLLGLSDRPLYPERLLWAAAPEVATPERYWIYIRPATRQVLLVMVGSGSLPYAALRQQAQAVIQGLITPPPQLRLLARRGPNIPAEELAAADDEPLPAEAFRPLFEDVPQPIPQPAPPAKRARPAGPPPPPPIEGASPPSR